MCSAPLRLPPVYVAASGRDARYTRICIASIRYFYPQVPIKLLAGGPLECGLKEELARYWDVRTDDVRPSNWGWGFVKLEPLFGRPGERFMVVDSDTVFAGHVLATWAASAADFLVDDEQQSEADLQRLYYDCRDGRPSGTAAAIRVQLRSVVWHVRRHHARGFRSAR